MHRIFSGHADRIRVGVGAGSVLGGVYAVERILGWIYYFLCGQFVCKSGEIGCAFFLFLPNNRVGGAVVSGERHLTVGADSCL